MTHAPTWTVPACPCLRTPLRSIFYPVNRVAFSTKAVYLSTFKDFHCLRMMFIYMLRGYTESLVSWSCLPRQPHLSPHPASAGHPGVLATVPLPCPVQVQWRALLLQWIAHATSSAQKISFLSNLVQYGNCHLFFPKLVSTTNLRMHTLNWLLFPFSVLPWAAELTSFHQSPYHAVLIQVICLLLSH